MGQRIVNTESLEDLEVVRSMQRRTTRQNQEAMQQTAGIGLYCIERRADAPDPQFPQVVVGRWYVITSGSKKECEREVVELRRGDVRRLGRADLVTYKVRPYTRERLALPLAALGDLACEPNLGAGARFDDGWAPDPDDAEVV